MRKVKSGYKIVKWFYGKKIEIPEEWNLSTLGVECKQIQDADHRVPPRTATGIPFLTINNIVENEIIDFSKTDYVSEEEYQIFIKKIKPVKGDLLYSRVATIGIARIITDDRKFVVTSNAVVIKSGNNLDSKYLLYLLNFSLIKNRVTSLTPGSAYSFISLKEINKIPVISSPLNQQQKIVSILSNMDNFIDSYSKSITQTKQLKKGLMQQLLTKGIGHKKFKEISLGKIPFEWKSSILGEHSKVGTGGTPSRNNEEYFQGNIPWVKTTEIRYNTIRDTEEKISKMALDKTSTKLYPKNTLLFAMYGQGVTRGKCAILGIDATINQACAAIIPHTTLDVWFLFYWLQFYYEKIRTLSSGSHQSNFNLDQVKKLEIGVPNMTEQKKIISILSGIDYIIFQWTSNKSNLVKIKKGLMQKLLTGEMRVKL